MLRIPQIKGYLSIYRHVAVGWGVVEDTLKTEVERRKENVGKRVTKVKLLLKEFFNKKQIVRF